MPKYDEYLEQYSAARRAANTYDAIVRDIRDERQQLQALQQLVASERNALVQLENAYDTEKTQGTLADDVLRATYSSEALAAQLAAQTKVAGAEARAVPRQIIETVERGEGSRASVQNAGVLAISLLRNRDRPMTQQAADATIAYLEALGDNLAAGTLQRAEQAAASIANRPTRGPGAPALTPEQAAQEAGRQRALEAVYHSSPQGYVGAFEGEAEARKRRTTKAPDDTAFSTADDALSAYIEMLEDGIATADELARITGRSADDAERDFRYAKSIYAEAKTKGSYQNRIRKYFEPSWLSQQARVTQLERELADATPEVRRSVSEEAARRVLQSRGLDPDDPYLQYRGTPKYDFYRTADRIFGEVDDVVPATAQQKQVAALLDLYERQGVEWKTDDLAAELGKTLSGAELSEAVGFGLALDRQRREGVKPPDQRRLQEEERKRIEEAERSAAELERLAREDIEAAKRDRDAVEADLERGLGRTLRTAPAAPGERSRTEKYQILRSSGMSPDEARATLGMETELEPTGADLRTPEQRAADLQRFEATGEDFTLRGEVVPADETVEEEELTDEDLLAKYRAE